MEGRGCHNLPGGQEVTLEHWPVVSLLSLSNSGNQELELEKSAEAQFSVNSFSVCELWWEASCWTEQNSCWRFSTEMWGLSYQELFWETFKQNKCFDLATSDGKLIIKRPGLCWEYLSKICYKPKLSILLKSNICWQGREGGRADYINVEIDTTHSLKLAEFVCQKGEKWHWCLHFPQVLKYSPDHIPFPSRDGGN